VSGPVSAANARGLPGDRITPRHRRRSPFPGQSTLGKYEPAGRRFFECPLHPGILAPRFVWPRPLSVGTHPTVTTCRSNTGVTSPFLKCTELCSRDRFWGSMEKDPVGGSQRGRVKAGFQDVTSEALGTIFGYASTEAGKSMKQPTPSDFIVNVQESFVSVIFKPSNSEYNFGRLADPADIARYGALSQSPNVRHGNTGDTGDYPPEEVAQMAHSLAVKAITTP
jgi:hypothetical protein